MGNKQEKLEQLLRTLIAHFCKKVTQEWLLSQPDSGLNSESSGSINFVEKLGFGLATWVRAMMARLQNSIYFLLRYKVRS